MADCPPACPAVRPGIPALCSMGLAPAVTAPDTALMAIRLQSCWTRPPAAASLAWLHHRVPAPRPASRTRHTEHNTRQAGAQSVPQSLLSGLVWCGPAAVRTTTRTGVPASTELSRPDPPPPPCSTLTQSQSLFAAAAASRSQLIRRAAPRSLDWPAVLAAAVVRPTPPPPRPAPAPHPNPSVGCAGCGVGPHPESPNTGEACSSAWLSGQTRAQLHT